MSDPSFEEVEIISSLEAILVTEFKIQAGGALLSDNNKEMPIIRTLITGISNDTRKKDEVSIELIMAPEDAIVFAQRMTERLTLLITKGETNESNGN